MQSASRRLSWVALSIACGAMVTVIGEHIPWESILLVTTPWTPWITVLATALSPLIAVQVTRYLDAKSAAEQERRRLFRDLMAHRMGQFESLEFVSALSLIDVEFVENTPENKAIREALSAYREQVHIYTNRFLPVAKYESLPPDQRNAFDAELASINLKRTDALVDLLQALALALGLDISRQAIAINGFWPGWAGAKISLERQVQEAQLAVFKNIVDNAAQPKQQPAVIVNDQENIQ